MDLGNKLASILGSAFAISITHSPGLTIAGSLPKKRGRRSLYQIDDLTRIYILFIGIGMKGLHDMLGQNSRLPVITGKQRPHGSGVEQLTVWINPFLQQHCSPFIQGVKHAFPTQGSGTQIKRPVGD